MNRYKLIVFDLDGTILDTTQGILLSVEQTIKKWNLHIPSKEVLLSFIGPPIQISFKKIYGLADDVIQEMATDFRNYYSNTDNLFKAVAYSGIYELFSQLKLQGYQIAIATYKREDYALRLLYKFNFNNYTDIMFGGDNENKLKKRDIIIKCMEKAKIENPREVIMVGDTDHDALGAAELGIDFIAVTYGFGFTKDRLSQTCNSTLIVNTPLEIIECLS